MTKDIELLVPMRPKTDGKQKGCAEMEKESKGFGRRDFMKLGIAAGSVAGIPTGIIPTTATRNALAKVGSNIRGVFPPTLVSHANHN